MGLGSLEERGAFILPERLWTPLGDGIETQSVLHADGWGLHGGTWQRVENSCQRKCAVLLLGLDSWWTHWALAVGSDHNWGNRAVALRGFSPETGELPVRRAGLRYRVPSHGDPYVDVVSRDPVLKPILS